MMEKDGIPVAGMTDVDKLEDHLEQQNPEMAKQIREGQAAYVRGEGHDLESFLTKVLAVVEAARKKG